MAFDWNTAKPDAPAFDWSSATEEAPPPSLLERAGQGVRNTRDALRVAATDDPAKLAEIASENAASALPPSAAARQMSEEIKPYQQEYDQAQGVGAVVPFLKMAGKRAAQFVQNPREFAGMVAENAPNSLPGMVAGVAGGVAGGALGGPAGATAGALAAGTAAQYPIEQGSEMLEQIRKTATDAGIDLNDRAALAEHIKANYPQLLEQSRLKGIGTAGTDALLNRITLGLAGAGERAIARDAAAITDAAKAGKITKAQATEQLAAVEAREAARNTLGAKATRAAGVTAGEMAGEAGSEAAGQLLAHGKIDPLEVIDEGLLGVGQGAAMGVAGDVLRRATGAGSRTEAEAAIAGAQSAIDAMPIIRAQPRQQQAAVQNIAAAPTVDAAIDAFAKATEEKPPVEFDRLGALGALHAQPEQPPASGPTHPLGDPNTIPYDYGGRQRMYAALPSPETPTGRTVGLEISTPRGAQKVERPVMVNDGDAELTRPEQYGDREVAINARQRAREEEADGPGVRDIVQTPQGPARRARVTLDEQGNVIEAEPRDRQYLGTVRRDQRPHAAAAINAHAVNPELTEAALAHPEMGPKAERAIFEAITHGRLDDQQTRSLIARYGLPAGRTDTTGPGAQPVSAEAPDRNAPAAGPGGAPVAGAVDGGGARVDQIAHEAATSPQNDLPAPTEGQKEAGNYKKGHARIGGLDVSIENPAGSKRRPEWPTLKSHYGYFKRTEGNDGDHVDTFIRPGTPEDYDGPVFVVDQVGENGRFDEHKVMLGWGTEEEARAAYLENYTPGWKGLKNITRMTMDEFKSWLRDGDTTKPAAKAKTEEKLAAQKTDGNLPDGVKRRVEHALSQLREAERILTEVERVHGQGHNLALAVAEQQPIIDRARKVLSTFRTMGNGNGQGVVPDRVIAALGGEPDLSRFETLKDQSPDAGKTIAQKKPARDEVGKEFSRDLLKKRIAAAEKGGLSVNEARELIEIAREAGFITDEEAHAFLLKIDAAGETNNLSRMLDVAWAAVRRIAEAIGAPLSAEGGKKEGEKAAISPPSKEERAKDADGNPIFKEGERVEITGGADKGRHGSVAEVSRSTVVAISFGGPRSEPKTNYHYRVKLDSGRITFASPNELQEEASPPPGVTPDPVWNGASMAPDALWRMIGLEQVAELRHIARAARARKPENKKLEEKTAQTHARKAEEARQAFDEWAAKYPDAAAKVDGYKPAAPKESAPVKTEAADGMPSLRIVAGKHTKTGREIWTVVMGERVERPVYDALNARAGRLGGKYSSFKGHGAIPGFIFYDEAKAKEFVSQGQGAATASPGQVQGTAKALPSPSEAPSKPLRSPSEGASPVTELGGFKVGDRVQNGNGKAGVVTGFNEKNGWVMWEPDGSGVEMGAAPSMLRREEEKPAPAKQPSGRREVGKNSEGATLYEDARGVRTLVRPGESVGVQETVELVPTRQGMQISRGTRRDEYKTVEELAAERPARQDPADILTRLGFKDSGPGPGEWVRAVSGLGDVIAKPIGNDRFEVSADYMGKRFATETVSGEAELESKADEFAAKINEGREKLAQQAIADERGLPHTQEESAALPDKAPDAKSPDQIRAEADLMAGLADLADIFGKNAKLNIAPEDEQKLIPVLTRVMDAAFRLGYIKFKQAAKFVLDTIRAKIGAEVADQITIDHLQGAYIGMAGKYQGQGADRAKDVVAVESIAEIENAAEQAQNESQENGNGPSTPPVGSTGNLALEEPSSGDVRAPQGGRDAGSNGAAGRPSNDGRKGQPDESGNPGGRGLGNGAGTVSVPPRGTGGKPGSSAVERVPGSTGNQPPVVQPGQRGPVERNPQATGDYRITSLTKLGEGGQKTKYSNNLAAIRLVKTLQAEGRGATPDEQHVLARYVGWGGIPQAFDKNNEKWAAEYRELKDALTPDEWQDAFDSTQFAHYTSENVIGAMYQALARMGVKGGVRFLEAGSGVGNFVGLAPQDMLTGSRFTGIERDAISGAIAQYLYPNQSMQVADFTRWNAADGTFDVSIGNPPFSRNELTDASGRKHLSRLRVHNYFFGKSVDLLREGGIFAEVVSNGFMDSRDDRARKYIGERTRLLGAIRLPNNAFKGNANTEVTTDIVFLQKLPAAEWGSKSAKEDAKRWMDLVDVPDPLGGNPIPVNRYFAENPSMMLGRMERAGSMYGPDQPALIARDGADIAKELARAIKSLPENVYQPAAVSNTAAMEKAQLVAMSNITASEGGYFVRDGQLYQRAPNIAGEQFATKLTPETQWTEKTALGAARHARLTELAHMTVLTRQLIAAEISNADADTLTMMRADLNSRYDAYVKAHGPLNARPNLQLYDEDPDLPLLLSLERDFDPGITAAAAKRQGIKAVPPSAKKADILTRRVNYEREAPEKADSPADAVMISIAERGKIDPEYIADLLGQDADGILQELAKGDKPALFLDPATNGYVLADEYLSGNVRKKLLQAKAAHLFDNVRALEAVQPKDIPSHEIIGKIGANWIPNETYEEFARELFGSGTSAQIRYVKANSSFIVDIEGASEIQNFTTWGVRGPFNEDKTGPTLDFSGARIFANLLNNKEIKVGYYDDDHKFHLSKFMTDAANDKAAAIRERFGDWLMADPARSEMLTRQYNDTMNNYVNRRYDGSLLRFPGKVPDEVIKFRKHQRNAIARIMQDRQVLLDHVVGAGKTYTVIAAAMELRRTGLARKPLITVPNHLVKQWAADFYRLYPGAKILAATKKDFEKVNRRRFLAKIATGDWDAVILAHSSFGFIKPPAEFEEVFAERQIAHIIAEIEAMGGEAEKGRGNKNDSRDSSTKRTVKQLAAMRDRLKERVKRLRDKPMDDLLDFEQLGVDMLMVDEAHLFKNLMYATKMQNVRGMGSPEGSQRAYDMYIKTQYIMEKYGKGVVFATGTPVSNSLAEMYHMLRYLSPSTLADMKHETFDAWANTFASVEQVWMQALSGEGFKATTRLDKFVNAPELLKVFGQVADTVTMDDIKQAFREENPGKEFPLPPLKGDRRTPVSIPITQAQRDFMANIAKRAKALEKRKGPPKKGEDNMLSIMGDARRAAIDIRMVDPDVTERDPNGRLAKVAENVLERYRKYDDVKGTQLIFSDLGTPLKHARKELAEYDALQARAAPLHDESIRARAEFGDEEARKQIEDAEKAVAEMEANGKDWLDGIKIALRGFSVYDDLRKALIEGGVPENEIAFIHDYNTDEQKAALFKAVNQGRVRVLLGSTAKMGAGTNVQERLVALHHVDVPWKPSDIEQREGRIVRQGNELPKLLGPDFAVEIQAYVTQDTLDLFMWQLQEAKLAVIGQIRTGQVDREIDNAFEDMQMSAGEMQAAATSDPLLMKEIRLKDKIKKLERQKKSFEGARNDVINRTKRAEADVQRLPAQIERADDMVRAYMRYRDGADAWLSAQKAIVNGAEVTGADEIRAAVRKGVDAVEVPVYEKYGYPMAMKNKGEKDALQALVRKAWEESGVEFNGKTYHSESGLGDAVRALLGDYDVIAFTTPDGTVWRHRRLLESHIEPKVMNALRNDESVNLGKFGDTELVVEGAHKKDKVYAEITLKFGGREESVGSIEFDDDDKLADKAPSSVIASASRALSNSIGDASYLKQRKEEAERAIADARKNKVEDAWPKEAELTAAREEYLKLLKDMRSAGGATESHFKALYGYDPGGEAALLAPYASRALRGAGGGMPVDVLRFLADNMAGIKVNIAATQADLPDAAARFRSDISTNVRGVFLPKTGEIWLVAENLNSMEESILVLMHEGAHRGLRKMFGEDLKPVLNTIWAGNKTVRDQTAEYMAKFGIDRDEAIEEVLADMAGRGEARDLSGWEQLVEFIRTWVRKFAAKLGAKLDVSDAMVEEIVAAAVKQGLNDEAQAFDDRTAEAYSKAAPTFYSELAKQVAAHRMSVAPAGQWKATIRNMPGVKPDEIQWSGINEWLDMQQGKVTREAVLDFLRAGGVKVETTVLGHKNKDQMHEDIRAVRDQFSRDMEDLGYEVEYDSVDPEDGEVYFYKGDGDEGISYANLPDDARALADKAFQREMFIRKAYQGGSKFEQYSMPGGANYREVLLTLTPKKVAGRNYAEVRPELLSAIEKVFPDQRVVVVENAIRRATLGQTDEEALRGAGWIDELVKAGHGSLMEEYRASFDVNDKIKEQDRGRFRSTHWDQPNVLAHFRADVVNGADGKRYLRVFEIQSDWAQKGRKEGFGEQPTGRMLTAPRSPNNPNPVPMPEVRVGPPAAPFVQKTEAWTALAIKRAIRMAADEGLDGIVFATGEQMVDLFKLSKHFKEIAYSKNDDGTFDVHGTQTNGNKLQIAEEVPAEKLPDIIGKDLAQSVVEGKGEDGKVAGVKYLRGVALEVGGEGQKTFYDQIVPNVARDVAKKLGGTVGNVRLAIDTRSEGDRNQEVNRFRDEMHRKYGDGIMLKMTPEERAHLRALEDGGTNARGIQITDSMRERALAGMPLFSRLSDQLKGLNRDADKGLFAGEPDLDGGKTSKVTDTPAFRRWFSGSKVVNKDGKPEVAYHYTGGDFTEFSHEEQDKARMNPGGPAGYTTEFGRDFVFPRDGFFFFVGESPSKVPGKLTTGVPVYLSIKNPLDLRKPISPEDSSKIISWLQSQVDTPPQPGHWGHKLRGDAVGGLRRARKEGISPQQLWALVNENTFTNRGSLWNEMLAMLGKDGLIFDGNSSGTAMLEERRGPGDGKTYTIAVALHPEQIKSAIGNRGTFDPTDPDIRASRSPVAAAIDTLRSDATQRGALNTVSSLLESSNTFSLWHRTVGTQFHKARKDRDFGRVFRAVNNQIQDTARYAIEAEQEAPNILQRLEHIKDVGKALLQGSGKHQKDMRAVARAVFANIEGKAGVQQRVFSDAELRDQFQLNDRQIELYREFRRAVDTSLERLGQSMVMRKAGRYMDVSALKNTSMDDTVADVKGAFDMQIDRLQGLLDMARAPAEENRKRVREEIVRSLTVDDKGNLRQEFVRPEAKREIERATDDRLTAKLAEEIKTLRDLRDEIVEIGDYTHDLQDKGYAPAMRFGRYAVSVGHPDMPVFFGMYESQAEANMAALALRREYPGEEITKSVMNDEAWKMFAGVSPETVELFARFMGADESEGFKQYIDLATSSRSAMKRMLERKGVAGFSWDATRVLAQFVTSNARQASINIHAGEVNEALHEIPREKGDVQKEAQKLVDYVRNPMEEASALRGLLFMHFMGGSLASAAVNLTQPVLMTAPYLSQYVKGAKLGAIMARAAKAAATGKVDDPGMRAALQRANDDGITQPHEIHQLMADAQGSAFGRSGRGRAFAKAWGGFFALSEAFNRRLTFMAAYDAAREAGLPNAYGFAVNAVTETQGLYNKANRPNWARGPIGATIFTFKQFSISYLEFLARLPKKQMLIALAVLLVAAGLEGLPFADDIEDIIDTVGQRLGYATNSKKALRKAVGNVLGEGLAEFVLHGFSAIPGFPLDVSARLGMSNLIPGTRLLDPSKTDKAGEVLEVFGAAGGVAKGLMSAASDGSIRDAMPTAVRNAIDGYRMASTGEARDTRGRKVRDVTLADAAVKAIGFQPASLAADSRRIGEQLRDVAMAKHMESEIANLWARGIIEKDADLVAQARQRLQDWNAKNPDTPIVISGSQIARRVKEAQMTRDQRFIKTAPPEMRRQVMREIAQ